jgi:hypothetical protein
MINSAWSPDFPTAARQAMFFYKASQGVDVDGVVAIDQIAAQEMLGATGPIYLPEYKVTITSENLVAETVKHIETNPKPGEERKTFLSVLAKAEMDRIFHLEPDKWQLAVKQVQLGIAGRHIQIYTAASDAEAFTQKQGADGGLLRSAADQVAVVDNQVAYTKVAIFVDRTYADHITIKADGSTQHQLTLTYKNNGSTTDKIFGGDFENYLRVFAPKGTQVVSQSGYTRGFALTEEDGAAVMQGWVLIGAKQSVTVNLTYVVPPQAQAKGQYTLEWRKQAGVGDYPLQVQVTGPDGKLLTPVGTNPAPGSAVKIDSDKTFAWKR